MWTVDWVCVFNVQLQVRFIGIILSNDFLIKIYNKMLTSAKCFILIGIAILRVSGEYYYETFYKPWARKPLNFFF